MTEEEAKTKWCCGPLQNLHTAMFEAATRVEDTEGHFEDLPSGGLCIGSACMAWRWLNPGETFDEWRKKAYGYEVKTPDAVAGYCGLAGKT